MALDYTGKEVVRGRQIAEIAVEQLYQDESIAKGYIALDTGAKHGVTKTETSTDVTEQAYTGQALTGAGNFTLFDYQVLHTKTETKIDILQDTLRDTPFAEDMSAGAANIDSSRFMQLAAEQLGNKVAYKAMVQRWTGVTAATKGFIAGLTPGAGQGSISAGTQTKVAALPVTLRNGWLTSILYNPWNATKTPKLGGYIKVGGTAITAANIAAEYAKIYVKIPSVERDDKLNPFILNAPLSHKALIRIANNAVGAAQQVNFLDVNDVISYNGIVLNFVELPEDIVIGASSRALALNMDLESDDNMMEVGQYSDGSDVQYFRNINAWSVHVSKQDKIVLYGG